MTREVYPVMGIETYADITPFNPRIDNNVVHITGRIFNTYVTPESMEEINAVGLANTDRVMFHETEEKPLPEALKAGEMCLNDLWSVVVPGPAFKG